MRSPRKAIVAMLVLWPIISVAQDAEVGLSRNTVTVTVHEAVRVNATLAILNLGCRSIASEREDAYKENVRVASLVLGAILDAGVAPENVETVEIRLRRVVQNLRDGGTTVEFHANQQWRIRVRPQDAQVVVDRAVEAGANEVGDVVWTVEDPSALQDQARKAALERTRAIAEDIARRLGRQLGPLVYASNEKPAHQSGGGGAIGVGALRAPSAMETDLLLFPRKVTEQATIYAVFELK